MLPHLRAKASAATAVTTGACTGFFNRRGASLPCRWPPCCTQFRTTRSVGLHCGSNVRFDSVVWHAQGRSWTNLTIIKSAKCGATCNPHAIWSAAARKLVVTFSSHVGLATVHTADATGLTGWSTPMPLEPWIGKSWATNAITGPGVATAIALPGGGERLLFVAHAGAYKQDVVFFSDDAGATFNVSASTPYGVPQQAAAGNVLKAMDEAAFAQMANGSVLLVLRNLGGKGEARRFKNGSRPLYHNPACADDGKSVATRLRRPLKH